MSRRRLSANNAAAALLAEVRPHPTRPPRESAVLVLRYLGPLNPALRSLPALYQLRDHFGAGLGWLDSTIEELEAAQ